VFENDIPRRPGEYEKTFLEKHPRKRLFSKPLRWSEFLAVYGV
jgi:hypothetical protein